ncbi:MAG: two component transcriptional regulator, winged helix family [Anaerospora sp.]|nr:two component transcriptional regulator, winged helix family [Anaerospora sp.]
MKLLLVDDEKNLTEALSYLLKRNGFVVDVASDGEAGVEMACTGSYDIIILDRMLPGQDGLSILREFRSLGHDTPVMILTAKDTPEDRAEGLNAGADDYLVKPFFTVELLARLHALARRRGKVMVENIVVTKERILEKVWGYNSDTEENTINIYIHYLRKKLNISNLKTVRGVGYYLQKQSIARTAN